MQMRLKIATYNLWGDYGPPERKPLLLKALRDLEADLLCLQESVDPDFLNPLPHRTRFHAPTGNLSVLSRFPATEHRILTYRTRSTLEAYTRAALAVRLEVSGRPFWAVTTHLSWKAEDEATRTSQAEELLKFVEPFDGAVLVTGDLNTTPDRPPVRRLRKAGFRDLFEEANPSDPGITWDNRNPFIRSHTVVFPDRRIDYLLLRNSGRETPAVDEADVVLNSVGPEGFPPSDHYGVCAVVRFPRKNSSPR